MGKVTSTKNMTQCRLMTETAKQHKTRKETHIGTTDYKTYSNPTEH